MCGAKLQPLLSVCIWYPHRLSALDPFQHRHSHSHRSPDLTSTSAFSSVHTCFWTFPLVGLDHTLERIHPHTFNLAFDILLGTLPCRLHFSTISRSSASSYIVSILCFSWITPHSSPRVVATSLRRCDVPLVHYYITLYSEV